jgi:predicted nucleic acid-binding protein
LGLIRVTAAPVPEELVVDASVLGKWIRTEGEAKLRAARQLRARFAQGAVTLVVPPLLYLELLNAAARRWKWSPARVARLASRLRALGLVVDEPPPVRVAHWTNQGLTAYDACYVALAEHRRCVLVTEDTQILATGGALVRPL